MALDSSIDSVINSYSSGQDIGGMMNSLGINMSDTNSMFSWPNLIGGTIFGIIGWCAFSHGRKEKSIKPTVIGIVLMVYPFFIQNTIWLYIIGVVVTSLLYFLRD